jgi:hypothetical protein
MASVLVHLGPALSASASADHHSVPTGTVSAVSEAQSPTLSGMHHPGNEERSGEPAQPGGSTHGEKGHAADGDSCGLMIEPDSDIVSEVADRAHDCQSRLQLPEFAALDPSSAVGTSCPDLAADLQVIRV